MNRVQDVLPDLKNAIKQYCSSAGIRVKKSVVDLSIHGSQKQIMAVWVFNKPFDELFRRLAKYDPDSSEPVPYEMVTIPYATNPNIQAQQDFLQ